MKKRLSFLIMAVFLRNAAATGAPVVDGTLDAAEYGSAIAVQTVETQFGDNFSELDAAYATIVSNKLYLMLTGNLENNFNKLEIFIDSTDAVTSNVLDMPGNDGTDALDGLVFDAGFSPDYNFHIRHGGSDFYIDFADLASREFAQYGPFFGGSSEGSTLTSTSAVNASVIGVGFNNSNTAGIGGGTGAADPTAATNVMTGLELCIDLGDLGNPLQTIRIAALINSSANNFLSNQMLGGLPAGTSNLGAPDAVDLNDSAGDQFFTVNIPAVLSCELTDSMGGSMEAGETNTFSISIPGLQGIASNITSSLAFAPAGGLSVISSNTPAGPLTNGYSLLHTYDVVADTNGFYTFTAEVFTNGAACTTDTFELTVGRQVRFDSLLIANETNGIPGTVEPGESFDLIITSINDGVGAVNDITNTLTAANPAFFQITPTSDFYDTLGAGESTVTVYHVSCSADTPDGPQTFTVINRSGAQSWPVPFDLDIYRRAVPSVSDSTLIIRTAPGQTDGGSVTLANDGNMPVPFSVTADSLPVFYTVEQKSLPRISFWPADVQPNTVFSSWAGTDSTPMSIGFGFTLHGTEYTRFSAGQDGTLTLSNGGAASARLSPFRTSTLLSQATIRYDRVADGLLVIAWGNGTGQEFQVHLHADGTFDYLYEFGTWGAGIIGLDAGTISQTITHTPGQVGNDALHLAPQSWVSFDPQSGGLSGYGSSRELTFTANATEIMSPATYTFTATVHWEDSLDDIDVTVLVEPDNLQLDVPNPFSFSGPAGTISSPAVLTITNSGNVPLTYSITDSGAASAGYTNEMTDYQWRHIPETADTVLGTGILDTEPVDIGFPFVFFGRARTNLTVQTDGTLLFDDGAVISPYSAGLTLDSNAQVRRLIDTGLNRFTVTWENMAEPNGDANQTFQVVLNRDGSIRQNYQRLRGRLFDEIESIDEIPIIGITYVTNTIGNITRIDEVETVTGMNSVTNYNENFDRRSYELTPVQLPIISFSPVSGTIPQGEQADITLIGDARSLTANGSTNATAATILAFNYGTANASSEVTFTATNSVETAFPAADVVKAMWGSDEPVVSTQLNPDGSRTLTWPAPADDLPRTYIAWFTTDLKEEWHQLGTVKNGTQFVDNRHNDEPVVFYKVTVQ